jgi:hypothetical protein
VVHPQLSHYGFARDDAIWWVLGHIILSAAQIQEPKNHRKMSVVTSAARNRKEKTRSI